MLSYASSMILFSAWIPLVYIQQNSSRMRTIWAASTELVPDGVMGMAPGLKGSTQSVA
jgi:hypothetical protein